MTLLQNVLIKAKMDLGVTKAQCLCIFGVDVLVIVVDMVGADLVDIIVALFKG